MTFETVLLIVGAMVAFAAIAATHRIIAGPTILDRAVASDLHFTLAVMALALYAATTGAEFALTAMLGVTATGFLSTIAIARFVGNQEGPGRRAPQLDDRSEIVEHEAVHLVGTHHEDDLEAPLGHPGDRHAPEERDRS